MKIPSRELVSEQGKNTENQAKSQKILGDNLGTPELQVYSCQLMSLTSSAIDKLDHFKIPLGILITNQKLDYYQS